MHTNSESTFVPMVLCPAVQTSCVPHVTVPQYYPPLPLQTAYPSPPVQSHLTRCRLEQDFARRAWSRSAGPGYDGSFHFTLGQGYHARWEAIPEEEEAIAPISSGGGLFSRMRRLWENVRYDNSFPRLYFFFLLLLFFFF